MCVKFFAYGDTGATACNAESIACALLLTAPLKLFSARMTAITAIAIITSAMIFFALPLSREVLPINCALNAWFDILRFRFTAAIVITFLFSCPC